MIDGTYAIEVDTPAGRKSGRVTLATQGSAMTMDLDAPIIGKQHAEGSVDGDTFAAEGKLKMLLLGKMDYTLTGKVDGDAISASIHTSKGDFEAVGVRA